MLQQHIFEYTPTGVLYKTKEEAFRARKHKMLLELKSSGLLCQANPIPTSECKPGNGWFKSNEPEDHLDEVATKLRNRIGSGELSVGMFSYKDQSLADRLKQQHVIREIYAYELEQHASAMIWPEDSSSEDAADRIRTNIQDVDIFIMRHYLEHYERPELIIRAILSVLNKDGLIYIEIPDCSQFIKRKNPLFMWEQHKNYFTERSFYELIKSMGIQCTLSTYGDSIEPSICCLLESHAKQPFDESFVDSIKKPVPCIDKKYWIPYIDAWKDYFSKITRPQILIGVGHNSDRFLQITESWDKFEYIVDSDTTKRGLYVGRSTLQIQNEMPKLINRQADLILGVHDRSYSLLKQKLLASESCANIKSIF